MKIYYEVGIYIQNEGTLTIADFDTEKEATDFVYEYKLKFSNQNPFIDTITFDYITNTKN